ncbi:hypothetical protein CQ052_19255 [Ochrobactrum sp. MYb15]|uniref:hypothetical protein n=1 Tax=Brucella pituitosa TaxID=571256 RepID=UPI000C275EF0|nr:hypothetical protein [Brucella pituitosa]PQZ47199.1 hypothetical protein CQZ90_19715 [Ochrobactrum sp. MYb19]PRA46482.1 hypothetical protein CQ062_23630 [Ochrobactrum sp. MYb68]PRA61071.1 hypothetical protein CQ053_20585 [Ochrobactrum sp. MYb18]PRA74777.1 hypothetical protein CQ049_16350 [Brucella thiophenivorans]PRA84948.1 hypothetical protein CQ054_15190 [Ochrobactrum sp. MYb29]PRA86249.1 hypothetical protein CQ051_20160 [Ochrobactrum sp. MYb14]PRA97044.1 hypothetical protein CQ052_1925
MKPCLVLALLLFSVAAGASVKAADLHQPFIVPEAKPAGIDGWTFAASPYFWGASISGDVGQFGLPAVHLESDFGDILKDLDFGFMAIGEARYDRFSIFGDVMYTKLSSGASTPLGVVAGRVDVTSETFAGLVGAGYAVFQEGRSNLDLVAGARVWHASTEISFSGGVLDGVSGSDGATWVDAMAGFRGRYFLSDSFYLSAWGLIGAGQADLDWDLAAGLGYEFNDRISSVAGYRALGVDYSNDGFVFDAVQQGPILGLVLRF